MRRSRFDVLIRDFPDAGEHVLYSALLDQYAGLDDASLAAVERCERGESLEAGEGEVVDLLAGRGFLVPDRAADDRAVAERFERLTGDAEALSVILMPTAACNLACAYCYQAATPTGDAMTPEVERQSVEWILDRVAKLSSKRLEVVFFGGEPLLRKDYVKRVAAQLRERCAGRGVAFGFGMISNGTLLDERTLLELKALGFAWCKITLDGDRSSHDLVRLRRGGQGTFDACVRAVKLLVEHGVAAHVGGNFQAHQQEGFLGLLDLLEREGLKDRLAYLNFKPALDTGGGSCAGCAASSTDQRVFTRLATEAEARGFRVPNRTQLGPCELHHKASFTIDEHGHVYKCGGLTGHPEVAVAHVRDAAAERRSPVGASRPWRLCGDCPYVPSCHGGCLAAMYLRHGRPDEVNCERHFFETTARAVVKQRYLAEFHPERLRPPKAA